MRLQTSTTSQNTKQWQCKMIIHSLETLNQCFCEVDQKSAKRDGQNVDLQLAGGGGGGGRTTPPTPPGYGPEYTLMGARHSVNEDVIPVYFGKVYSGY